MLTNDAGQVGHPERSAPSSPTQLVIELWGSLAPAEIPVPEWQLDLIRDRLAALEDVQTGGAFSALGSGPQASFE